MREISRASAQAGGSRLRRPRIAYSSDSPRRLDRSATTLCCSTLYQYVHWRHLKWRQREFSLRLPYLNAGGKLNSF